MLTVQLNKQIDQKQKISPIEQVENSFKLIAPIWPLNNFIAVNPLHGFESINFAQAIEKYYKNSENLNLQAVNIHTIKWCQLYFDNSQATIPIPFKNLGLYQAWLKLAYYDQTLSEYGNYRTLIKELPKNSIEAIEHIIKKLKITPTKADEFFENLNLSLKGWSGYIKYLQVWNQQNNLSIVCNFYVEYMALRLALIYLICPDFVNRYQIMPKSSNNAKDVISVVQDNESGYVASVLPKILNNIGKKPLSKQNYLAQLIFCIDVRSERIRRAIESQGDYTTLGFAGFFGLATRIKQHSCDHYESSCPVLVKPNFDSIETVNFSFFEKIAIKISHQISNLYVSCKYNMLSPFILPEAFGWIFMLKIFKRTFLHNFFHRKKLNYKNDFSYYLSLSAKEQADIGYKFLQILNLSDNFAKFIVICGHGGQTSNNKYSSGLDCGACGARQGGANARILAQILNNNQVRYHLKQKGIFVPQETIFIAAQHNTTTEDLIFFDTNIDSPELTSLKQDLDNASKLVRIERSNKDNNYTKFISNANSWSETRPEWGLAKNASMFVAPRFVTKAINLEGRAFLHEYFWQNDHDLSILQLIMSAPVVVAQWINTQYLFSTIDNNKFGSGTKVTQSVIGRFATIQGNGSDIKTGLPWQSLYNEDQTQFHVPLRLHCFIYAPRHYITSIIDSNNNVKSLLDNNWYLLFCIDPISKCVYKYYNQTWVRLA